MKVTELASRREYAEYVPATKAFTPLLGAGESDRSTTPRTRRSRASSSCSTNKFRDFRTLYRWKMGGDATQASFREVLAPAGMDVAGFSIDQARRHVYASANDGGYSRLVVLDAKTYAPVDAAAGPTDAEHVYAGSDEPRRTLSSRSASATPQAPRTSYVWDWQTEGAHAVGGALGARRSTSPRSCRRSA